MSGYEPDEIFVSASKLKALADTGVTPFYLYDEEGIRQSAQYLRQQFYWASSFQNYFPLRENPNPALLNLLFESGLGVLACSKAELMLAQRCGFHGENLMYEPMYRDYEAASLAQELNAVWLLHSPDLIPMNPISRVLLQFYPQSSQGGLNRPSRGERSKNGFTYPQLLDAIRLLHARGVSKIGLSLQGSSSGFQPGFYASRASKLFQLLPEIREKTGLTVETCCLGDSLGPPYRPNTVVPQLHEEAAQIQRQYEALPSELRPRIVTTLSKQLMETHGILVTKVLEVRTLSRNFLILDSSVCQFLRPALKQAYRHISLLGKNQIGNRKRYQVAGYLPEEFDRFGEDRLLPEAKAGDVCIVHDVGCGARSMPMLYAMQPLCAEFLACTDGQIRQIGAARTEAQMLDFLITSE